MTKNPALQRLRDWQAETAIILGSGLSGIIPSALTGTQQPEASNVAHRKPLPMHAELPEISYCEFGEIPETSVPGHAGRFVLDEISGKHVIFAQGRVHLYEGHSARDVTAVVRILAEAGIKQLILTNATGSANPKFAPGSWMMITDQINLTGTTPLLGAPNFVDLTDAYSPSLRKRFAEAARKIDMLLYEGVYAGLLGPQYETPAEVRMLQKVGADAIGMSTVLEVIQARALGLEVAGFSCLTNLAAGISPAKLSHEEVLEIGKKVVADFARLLEKGLSI
jgi:purine-nucleoside phosphorylase